MDSSQWRLALYEKLVERDKVQHYRFFLLVDNYEKLLLENIKAREENSNSENLPKTISKASLFHGDITLINELERTVDLLKKQLEFKNIDIAKLETRLAMLSEDFGELKADKCELTNANEALRVDRQNLEDELQTLQLYVIKLEQKLTAIQIENADILDRYIKVKNEQVESLNNVNDRIWVKSNTEPDLTKTKPSRTAVTDPKEALPTTRVAVATSRVPTATSKSFDLPDDSYCLEHSKEGDLLAVGSGNSVFVLTPLTGLALRTRLVGPNSVVNSVDFSSIGSLLVAASSDRACHVWDMKSFRLADSLTGHYDKVLSAKFGIGDCSVVLSGGRDRVLRLWDLKNNICTKTIFLNSSCNSIIPTDVSCGVSAHLDKRLRYFDFRIGRIESEVPLPDRISSICLLGSNNQIVACCRDDKLYICDTRFKKNHLILGNDGFRVPCDWARITTSSDGKYVAAGSKSGEIVIWDTDTMTVSKTLSNGHKYPVSACSWNPVEGTSLLSVDIRRHLLMWD